MSNVSDQPVRFEKPKHPLAGLNPTTFKTFKEWKGRWDSTSVSGEKLGLLHCLQEMDCWPESRQESVFFVLDVANGCRTGKPYHCYCYGRDNSALDAISWKAFSVLCVKLFNRGRTKYAPPWWWMLEQQETFEKLMQFCMPEAENYRPSYGNERTGQQTEVFSNFLKNICYMGWIQDFNWEDFYWDDRGQEYFSGIKSRLISARPQFIEILHHIGQLNWLNRPISVFSDEFPTIDTACAKKLNEIAFRGELRLPRQDLDQSAVGYKRKPKTLHEAILGGSVAAEILIMNSIRQRESKRIAAIYNKAKQKQEQIERQVKLTRIQKAKEDLDRQADELHGK